MLDYLEKLSIDDYVFIQLCIAILVPNFLVSCTIHHVLFVSVTSDDYSGLSPDCSGLSPDCSGLSPDSNFALSSFRCLFSSCFFFFTRSR